MNWWNEFADRVEHDVPLARLTWFRLGGPARYLFRPRDGEDLARFLRRTRQEQVPVKVLGAGANVLVCDQGFDGAVIRLDAGAFKYEKRRGHLIEVGAGVDLMPFARRWSHAGLSGLECMAGIPATIGGAVRMNAGGRFGDFGSVVRAVDVVLADGTSETWPRERLQFDYRQSAIRHEIVVSAHLELSKEDPVATGVRYERYFAFKQSSQPMGDKSAGCIFKNPAGKQAGKLIDAANLKGVRRGGAKISTHHANFIVAEADAKASDVLALIVLVRERVRDRFAIELEVEIDVWSPVGVEEEIVCP